MKEGRRRCGRPQRGVAVSLRGVIRARAGSGVPAPARALAYVSAHAHARVRVHAHARVGDLAARSGPCV